MSGYHFFFVLALAQMSVVLFYNTESILRFLAVFISATLNAPPPPPRPLPFVPYLASSTDRRGPPGSYATRNRASHRPSAARVGVAAMWQFAAAASHLSPGDSEEDDEEAQLSSRESRFDSEDGSENPPSVVEIPRDGDIRTIASILGDIEDPDIKSVLEHIMGGQGYARQYTRHATLIHSGSNDAWSSTDILHDGLLFAGFDPSRLRKNNAARKAVWFKAFYGVEHTTAAPYLADLRKDNPGVDFKDCLVAMNWLTCYDTYPVLSARWGYCEEYIGPKVIEYGMMMAKLAREKIVFSLEHDIELGRSVDCATFMVREMRLNPSSEWFDWKTHSCGLVSCLLPGLSIICKSHLMLCFICAEI